MSDLRTELESSELGRRINALLQLLHEISTGTDVGSLLTLVCNKSIASEAPIPVKKLGYEIIRCASLSVGDWELVGEGLTRDLLQTQNPELLCAALHVISTVPSWKLSELLVPPANLGDSIANCLNSTARDVRRMAVEAMTHCLTSPAILETIVESADLRHEALTWSEFMGDRLLDPSDTVVAVTHAGLARLMHTTLPLDDPNSVRSQQHHRMKGLLCTRMLRALTNILERAERLPYTAQMDVCRLIACATETLICASNSQALAYAMEEYGWKGRGYYHQQVVDEVAAYMGKYIGKSDDCDPALVLAASSAVLQLYNVVTREIGAVHWALAKQWAPLAVKTMIRLSKWEGAPEARVQLAGLVCNYIMTVSGSEQYAVIKHMFPIILGLSTEWDRCSCFSLLWTVAADLDIRNRSTQMRGAKSSHGLDLNKIIEDPLVREIVTGVAAGGGEGSSKFSKFPAFREELVGSLVGVTLHHPIANVGQLKDMFDDSKMDQEMDFETVLEVFFGALSWLGTSRVVLQGCKSCLGWERDGVADSVVSTTAVVDLWLQLLQHSFQVASAVRSASKKVSFVAEDDSDPFGEKKEPTEKLEDKFVEMVDYYSAALQILLKQINMNWRVLSPSIKPRALWLCGHHLSLPPVLEDNWKGLLLSIRMALRPDTYAAKQRMLGSAAAQYGGLAVRSKGDADDFEKIRFEAENEMRDVGEIVLERIAAMLASSHKTDTLPTKAYKEICQQVMEISKEYTAGNQSDAGGRDRCLKVQQQLSPLLTAQTAATPEVAPEDIPKLRPLYLDNSQQEGYPMGPPISSALFRTARSVRYRKFESNVFQTVSAARKVRPYGAQPVEGAEPEAIELLPNECSPERFIETLMMGADTGAVKGSELTGFTDPLQLSAWHEIHHPTSTLTLHFKLRNRLKTAIQEVAVRLGVSGSISIGVKGPFLYRPPPLGAGDSISWSMDFSCLGFGHFLVQPYIGLGTKVKQDLGLRCNAYEVPATQLLHPAPSVYTGEVVFQQWSALPFSCEFRAASTMAGPEAGLYVLSNLQAHPSTSCVMAHALPAEGGFEATCVGQTNKGDLLGIVICGSISPVLAESADEGRIMCWITVRSSSASAMAAMKSGYNAWIRDLSGGLLRPAKELAVGGFVSGVEFAASTTKENVQDTLYLLRQSSIRDAPSRSGSKVGRTTSRSSEQQPLFEDYSVDTTQDAIFQEWQFLKTGKAVLVNQPQKSGSSFDF